MNRTRACAAAAGFLGLVTALAACQPSASENAAIEQSKPGVGPAPDNVFTQGNVGEASDPAIANTAAESHRRSRAAADATQQERTPGHTKGPGAPDTSGRASQERPTE